MSESVVFMEDCVEGMKRYPDKWFDLAVVDPPYGIGESMKKRENTISNKWKNPNKKQHNPKDWDKQAPEKQYFDQLIRVSKNQIVWGANHFIENMPYNSSGWIVWDKKNGDNDFSDAELAFTSFQKGVRIFEWLWSGFKKQKPETRIHPTQKQVALYEWILRNYAKPGDKILDTHLGSGSSRIAAYKGGFDFTGFEIDRDYFEAQENRFKFFAAQMRLF